MRIESIPGKIAIQSQEVAPARLSFRPGQWLQAEVISIGDEAAVLDFQGIPIRVRPLVPLSEGMKLLLQVISTSGDQILLRLTEPGDVTGPDLSRLLSQAGIPATDENRQSALALLRFGLPPSPGEIALITQAVRSDVAVSMEAAALARALGLPLTPEVLTALSDRSDNIGTLWQNLLQDAPDEAAQALNALPVPAGGEEGAVAASLRQAILLLGRSLENKLLHGSPERSNDIKAALLQAMRSGADAEDLLRLLHSQQFTNLPRPDQTHPFLYFQFPMRFPEGMQTAELRIEREGEGGLEGDGAIQAIFRIQTFYLGVVEALLTLMQGSISCGIRCENEATARLMREEGDRLRQALTFGMKYAVAPVKITVGGVFEDLRAEPARPVARLNEMV